MKRALVRSRTQPSNPVKLGNLFSLNSLQNPFKGGTKIASAGVTTMKKGVGIFVKVRF